MAGMIAASPAQLEALAERRERVRNMCVLAHVDHGKTTLSDHLIASNGLIHPRLVGKLRFLDSRDDEQQRGVTMKSSAIALLFRCPAHLAAGTPGPPASAAPAPAAGGTPSAPPAAAAAADGSGAPRASGAQEPAGLRRDEPMGGSEGGRGSDEGSEYLINLIDSPGHIDFCSEVSTAARLSDGALVLVDVCEGVHIQTHAVLRQAWGEDVKPVLILNKVDRLISELRLSPLEAYERMKGIIAEVNNIINGFRSEKYISSIDSLVGATAGAAQRGGEEEGGKGEGEGEEEEDEGEEEEEEDLFSPEKGNVAFASAADGWAFRTEQFAHTYAQKLGASVGALKRALWGDRYFSPRTKQIMSKKVARKAQGGHGELKLKPMFAQFVLGPIWQVYELVQAGGGASAGLQKVISSLGLPVPQKDLQHKDPRVVLKAVMGSWLPLAPAVLSMVVDHLPDPIQGQRDRINRFLPDFARYERLANSWQPAGAEPAHPGGENGAGGAEGAASCDAEKGTGEVGRDHANGGEAPASAATTGAADSTLDPLQQHERAGADGVSDAERTEGIKGAGLRELQRVVRALRQCDASDSAPCVVFVSKMIAVPKSSLPREAQAELQAQAQAQGGAAWGAPGEEGGAGAGEGSEFGGQDCFLAFARIFSGRLRPGQRLCVLSSLYDPLNPDTFQRHRQYAEASSLFLMMGRGLEPLRSAPAGNLVAILGLQAAVLKSATLASTPWCPPFATMVFQAAPIVRVAVEPQTVADLPALSRGLRLLNRADPFVEVTLSATGEHVIAAAGEVHLERCIKDLQERFAGVMLSVSKPLVPFRETVQPRGCAHLWAHLQDPSGATTLKAQSSAASRALPMTFQPTEGAEAGSLPFWLETVTPSRQCRVRAHVLRLPDPLTRALEKHQGALYAFLAGGPASGAGLGQLMPGAHAGAAGAGAGPSFGAAAAAAGGGESGDTLSFAEAFARDVREALEEVESQGPEGDAGPRSEAQMWRRLLGHVWSLGPKHCGPNLLLAPSALTPLGRSHREGGGGTGEAGAGSESGASHSSHGNAPTAGEGLHRRDHREGPPGRDEGAAGAGGGVLIRGTLEASQKLRLSFEARTSGSEDVGLAEGGGSEERRGGAREEGSEGRSEGDSDRAIEKGSGDGEGRGSSSAWQGEVDREAQSLAGSVVSGFQLATAAGPLCEEPMRGLAFVVEAYLIPETARQRPPAPPQTPAAAASTAEPAQDGSQAEPMAAREQGAGEASASTDGATVTGGALASDTVTSDGVGTGAAGPGVAVTGVGGVTVGVGGPLSGQLIAAVKEACRGAVLASSPRLAEAMFFCEIITSTEALGQVYAVLGRRRADIVREEMREGSGAFTVHAHMPVAESFGFAEELRKKTSGAASPQLILSHWSMLEEDPFFVPRTEEEREEFGEGVGLGINVSRRLIDQVRRRKGLPVEEEVVAKATKQRTLARKV